MSALLVLVPGLAQASTVGVLGNTVWDEARILSVVGAPPAEAPPLGQWADDALARLVAAYVDAGYSAARGWTRVEGDHVDIEVDEGHIGRVVFEGPDAISKILFSKAVVLPGDVFYEPTFEAQLAQLEDLQGIRGAAWSVREGDEGVRQDIPGPVREQVLVVEVQTVQQVGFGYDVGFDPIYGIVVSPSFARPDLAAEGDHFRATASLAAPIHQYLWEADPKPRWIYGQLGLEYQMRGIGRSRIAPRFAAAGELVQTPRVDRGLEQLMVESSTVGVDLVFAGSARWSASAGGFASQSAVLRTLAFDDADPAAFAPPQLDDVVRFGLTAGFEAWPKSTMIRKDLRPRVLIDGALGWSATDEPYARVVGDARGAFRLGPNLLLLGLHAGLVAGDVRLYDAMRVAGRRQRTSFQDLYYTRALAQAEADLRFKIVRDFQVGAFYQHTLFEDTLGGAKPPTVAWVNSFGPGLHLLVVDQFSVDVYWAMGLAPRSYETWSANGGRFSQTLSISLNSVY